MNTALIASAALLGLAGTPHCAAMCAAPCAAVVGLRRSGLWTFLLARAAGYATAGALAAGSVEALSSGSQWSPALRPLWAALHLAVMVLGLWMLWQGRQPGWMSAIGRSAVMPAADSAVDLVTGRAAGIATGGWQPLRGPLRAAAAGGLWVAWPCGLLQSALIVASLAGSAPGGAAAMAAFALASSAGLVAAPWVWRWLLRGPAGRGLVQGPAGSGTALVRVAGALLVLGSGFALGHGVWHRVAVYCGLA